MLRARDARSGGGRRAVRRLHPLARDRHRAHGRLAVPARVRAQRAHLRRDAGARLRGRVPAPAGARPRIAPSSPGCSSSSPCSPPTRSSPSCGSPASDHRTAVHDARARPRRRCRPARPPARARARRRRRRRRGATASRPVAPSSWSTSTSATRTGSRRCAGVDLHIGAGEKVALVGPNGAGKSTLMLQLNGTLRPAHGSVRVAGLAVGKDTIRRVRSEVGLVFQDPDDQLFSPTVFDDVAFGPLHMGLPADEVHRRVERALAAVGMAAFAHRVPHRMSLGQRKRVALATVLSMDPSILVFDEPSAGPGPARPARAHRAAPLAGPDDAGLHARHAAGRRGLPADRGDGRRAGGRRRADRRGSWPTRRSSRRTGSRRRSGPGRSA